MINGSARASVSTLSSPGAEEAGSGTRRWYVAHTQPRAENRAVMHLERQGYETFCPRYRKVIRHARKRAVVLMPLFPCYLFLRFDALRHQWRSVNGTRGVARLLTHGDIPSPVPHGVVEALQDRVGPDGVIDLTPPLRMGQTVQLMDGPFESFVGRLSRLDGAGRVCVLLDVLGRAVSVTMDIEALRPSA